MRKNISYPLASFVTILLLVGCAGNAELRSRLGEEFSLRIGQSVAITGEDLEIRFVEVSEDSRCPKDVTCVWEGRVSTVVEISTDGSSQQLDHQDYTA